MQPTTPASIIRLALIMLVALAFTGCVDPANEPNTGNDDENSVRIDDEAAEGELIATLEAVRVSGSVTRDGTPVDQLFDWAPTTQVVFTDVRTQQRYEFETSSRPKGHWEGVLFAGAYDITLEVSPPIGACSGSCVVRQIGESVRIDESRTFDVDVPFIRQDGVLTLDGATVPADTGEDSPITRGQLVFVDTETGAAYPSELAKTGPAAFEAVVPKGAYEVWWQTSGISYYAFAPGDDSQRLPGGTAYLGTHDMTDVRRCFDLDAESVHVSGEVSLDGADLPDDSVDEARPRATLDLWTDGPVGRRHSVALGESGPATYDAWLFAGEYRAEVRANTPGAQDVLRAGGDHDLCRDHSCPMPFYSDEQVDFALPDWADEQVLEVSGRITVDPPQADSGSCHAVLTFRALNHEQDGAQPASANVGDDGTWRAFLYPGRYEVSVKTYHACDFDGGTVLDDELVVGETRTGVNYTVGTGRVSGEITLGGGQMPDDGTQDTDPRAAIRFEHIESGDIASAQLGDSGPATFDMTLAPGRYRVRIASYRVVRGIRYFDQDVLPRGARDLGFIDVVADGDHQLSYDLDVVRVNGALEVVGEPFDLEPYEQRETYLQFRSVEDDHTVEVAVPADGGAFEDVLFYEGQYELRAVVERGPTTPWGLTAVDWRWQAPDRP